MHSCLLMIGHVLDFIVIVLTRIAEVNKNGKIKRLWDWFLWGLRHHPRPEPCSPPAWFYWFLGQSFVDQGHLSLSFVFFWDLGSNSLWSEASRCVGRNPAAKAGSHLSVQWRTLTIFIVCSIWCIFNNLPVEHTCSGCSLLHDHTQGWRCHQVLQPPPLPRNPSPIYKRWKEVFCWFDTEAPLVWPRQQQPPPCALFQSELRAQDWDSLPPCC